MYVLLAWNCFHICHSLLYQYFILEFKEKRLVCSSAYDTRYAVYPILMVITIKYKFVTQNMLKENKQLKCKYFLMPEHLVCLKTQVNKVVVVSIQVYPVQTSGLGKISLKLERLKDIVMLICHKSCSNVLSNSRSSGWHRSQHKEAQWWRDSMKVAYSLQNNGTYAYPCIYLYPQTSPDSTRLS